MATVPRTPAAGAAATPVGRQSHGAAPTVSFTLPIVYGNSATTLDERADKSDDAKNTHRWVVYVRSANRTALAPVISKVTFKLHESFNNPTRNVIEPPFEISECGWGEFHVHIKVHFADPKEKPVLLTHFLKLYPNEDTVQLENDTLVSERYDEIVFLEPEAQLRAMLEQPKALMQNAKPPARDYGPGEAKQLGEFQAANTQMRSRLSHAKAQFHEAEAEVQRLKRDIAKLQ